MDEEYEDLRPLSELTVSDFMKMIGLEDERKKLDDAAAAYKKLISRSNDVVAASQKIFSNVDHLSSCTTPFEISSQDAWKKFSDGVHDSLADAGLKVVLSIATIEESK